MKNGLMQLRQPETSFFELGRQSDAACFGGKTASVVEGQGSRHVTWTCSLAWASSSAGAVSWVKERVGRHQLLKCHKNSCEWPQSQRVADDATHQELRAIGENSAADGQVLPTYLDISKDPLPPSAEEFTQTGPEEETERHERFENRSSGHVQQESSAQSHSPENESHSGETSSKLEESEVEKSEMPRRRFAGKRTVENDAHVLAKKERAECTDLSLACPLPRPPQSPGVDPERGLRLLVKRPPVDNHVDQSKRSCVKTLNGRNFRKREQRA